MGRRLLLRVERTRGQRGGHEDDAAGHVDPSR